jgi:ribosomal protein L37AE/L43A
MKIKKILSQSRRDFTAMYECEHCNAEVKGSGYDDSFFHQQVIPHMICKSCGEKSPEDYRGLAPKYSSSEVV